VCLLLVQRAVKNRRFSQHSHILYMHIYTVYTVCINDEFDTVMQLNWINTELTWAVEWHYWLVRAVNVMLFWCCCETIYIVWSTLEIKLYVYIYTKYAYNTDAYSVCVCVCVCNMHISQERKSALFIKRFVQYRLFHSSIKIASHLQL